MSDILGIALYLSPPLSRPVGFGPCRWNRRRLLPVQGDGGEARSHVRIPEQCDQDSTRWR